MFEVIKNVIFPYEMVALFSVETIYSGSLITKFK